MRDSAYVICIFGAALLLGALVGCVAPSDTVSGPCDHGASADFYRTPSLDSPGARPCCPRDEPCPDGSCQPRRPLRPLRPLGSSESQDPAEAAAGEGPEERPRGGCIDGSDPLADAKTGVWRCEKCRRGQIGAAMHTSWNAEGDAITYLCEQCWQTSSQETRLAYLETWLKNYGLSRREIAINRQAVSADR